MSTNFKTKLLRDFELLKRLVRQIRGSDEIYGTLKDLNDFRTRHPNRKLYYAAVINPNFDGNDESSRYLLVAAFCRTPTDLYMSPVVFSNTAESLASDFEDYSFGNILDALLERVIELAEHRSIHIEWISADFWKHFEEVGFHIDKDLSNGTRAGIGNKTVENDSDEETASSDPVGNTTVS